MRKFYLQNESGARLNLMGERGVYLFSPTGLGIEYNDSFRTAKKSFYKRVKEEQAQTPIGGTLIFIEYEPAPYEHIGPYELYAEFVSFCERAERLYFVYAPLETEYYCEVLLNSIDKSELTDGDSLQCDVKFLPMTMWYSLNAIQLTFDDSGMTSRYPGRYTKGARYGAGNQGFNFVQTLGHAPAAVRVAIQGECVNPSIKLQGVTSGILYGECSITGEFARGDTIVLCTKYQDSYVQRIRADGTADDLTDSIDITKDAFFHIPLSEKCIITANGGNRLVLSGEVYDYYRSV